jgi:hypothetical protein
MGTVLPQTVTVPPLTAAESAENLVQLNVTSIERKRKLQRNSTQKENSETENREPALPGGSATSGKPSNAKNPRQTAAQPRSGNFRQPAKEHKSRVPSVCCANRRKRLNGNHSGWRANRSKNADFKLAVQPAAVCFLRTVGIIDIILTNRLALAL